MAWKKQKKRVKTPTILQMEATECGAAALAIILAYYGRYVNLEKMRVDCGVSRDGSNASNMLKAARTHGLIAQGVEVQHLNTLKKIPFPYILFWEFNHFVVLDGISDHKYYINDPAVGPRTVDSQEFNRSFTGVVLTFKPSKRFKKDGKPFSIYKALKERLQTSQSALCYVILASLSLVIPGIIIPGFSKVFIDDILIHGMYSWLNLLLAGLALTAILRGLLTWLKNYYLLRIRAKYTITASAKFLWHVFCLPIQFFQQRYAGDVQERISANERIAQLLSNQISASVVSLISLVFYAVVMAFLSWPLTLMVMFIATINIILFYQVAKKIADLSRRFLQERGRLTGLEMFAIQAIESLKAMGRESDFFSRWAGFHVKTINSQQQLMFFNQFLLILPRFFLGLLTVAILGVGSWQIMQGELTVGTLVAFQSLVVSFNAPLINLISFANGLQQIRGDLTRLDDVLRHPIDSRLEQTGKHKLTKSRLDGAIQLKHVHFGYSKLEAPFIDDFNLDIKPGAHIAIVGKTGSGKSTIAKLLAGLYSPWDGEISFDGINIKDISPKSLAASLAYVDQDIFLYEGSIADNLTLWNRQYTTEGLKSVVAAASLVDTVAEHGGLSGHVAEGATNFSSGQRQRLEIARALLNNPSFLILDEATSCLDSMLEKEIYDNLKQYGGTLLIITHRMSTIRDCDEIIVLEEGKIIQQGTHDVLMKTSGLYQQLIV